MADIGGARRRSGRRWLWIVAGVAAVGAVAAVVAIWHLPARMYPAAGDAEARAALQGGLLTAAAALTAVAGGLIALDETRRANRDTHVRELYVEAAKLLNDPDSLGVRLAGIYALERIAVDSPADQRTVVEVLSAFVRERSTDPALRQALRPAAGGTTPLVRPMADIRAAVQVLGRLPVRKDVPRCDLAGANLTGPASLAGLTLNGANLAGAWLGRADLTGARLHEADLTDAWLDGATLTDAWLGGAALTGVRLGGATLTRTVLGAADLTGAVVSPHQLKDAVGSRLTRLPLQVGWPASWPR